MSTRVYLLLLKEEQKVLDEIGDGSSNPFPWGGQFYEIPGGYITIFYAPVDDDNPEILVAFEKKESRYGRIGYNISFTVDGEEKQSFTASTKYYLQVLSTVIKIICKFIDNEQPFQLTVAGLDKEDIRIPGQKDRIYFAFIEKHAEKLGYISGQGKEGLILQKKFEIENKL